MPSVPLLALSAVFHVLVGWRIAPDLSLYSPVAGVILWAWITASTVVLPMGLVKPKFAGPRLANVLTWVGLIDMGIFSSTFVLMVLRELLLGVVSILHGIGVLQIPLDTLRIDSALLVGPLALTMTLAGFWNARRTATVVRVDVPIANLPDSLQGFSIAQISDIHVGPTIRARYLQRIVERVNLLQADMVAITGDLVDGPVKSLGGHIKAMLIKVHAPEA